MPESMTVKIHQALFSNTSFLRIIKPTIKALKTCGKTHKAVVGVRPYGDVSCAINSPKIATKTPSIGPETTETKTSGKPLKVISWAGKRIETKDNPI